MKDIYDIVLNDIEIKSYIQERELSFLTSQIGYESTDFDQEKNETILRVAYLLLTKLLSGRLTVPSNVLNNVADNPSNELFDTAYSILKSFNIYDSNVEISFEKIFGIEGIFNFNLYYFYLSSLALLSDKTVSIRLDLRGYQPLDSQSISHSWKNKVVNKIFESFILLVRKQNGYADIQRSIQIINELKDDQALFEDSYLKNITDKTLEIENAHTLLGFYHLSKTITDTADYLTQGYNYKGKLDSEVRIHADIARKLFIGSPRIQAIVDILEKNLKVIQENSIWYSTDSIRIDKLREFCVQKSLAENSVIELLPSQRKALQDNLLNIASSVTVVEMPTSSGKTLLAEFNIIVTKALSIDSKIVYIVPSRALVNQVYFDLKTDFNALQFVIEKTSGAIEIDPSEDKLLKERIDILVSTPEKLDLLIRRNHDSVADVALFIVDEAHMIQNGDRGAKLELLLSILKRERPQSKFMFLSPFLRNSSDILADWMGGNRIRTSITVNWKPAEKILIGLKQKKNYKAFANTLLPSAYSRIGTEKQLSEIPVNEVLSGKPKQKYIEFAAKNFGSTDKSMLYICLGPGTVDKHAKFLASVTTDEPKSENIDLVIKYIQDEVGRDTVLTRVLPKRIALHHAGLSDDTKLLVEHLIREKEIRHVFATSTLAEGVNFPVSSVYFDSYKKGPQNDLSVNDFWNIAGRAGRTMVDNFGKLIFPF